MPNPTVVAASLDDQQLRTSIDALVKHVDDSFKRMVNITNTTVSEMQSKLQTLKNVDLGGASSSSSTRTTSIKKEIEARKELTTTLDQNVQALNRAQGRSDILAQYDQQIENLKRRLVEVRGDIDVFNYAIGSGKATQISWGQEGLKQANAEAEKLMTTILALEKQRTNLANVLNPGESFKNYVNSIGKRSSEIEALNKQIKEGSLLRQQSTKATKEDEEAMRQRVQREQEAIRQNTIAESQRRAEILRTAQTAQEATSRIIRSMHEQASDVNSTAPITGAKELAEAIRQMRAAYFNALSPSERTSPIGKALEEDIKRAENAYQVILKYNSSLLNLGNQNNHKIGETSTLTSLRSSLKLLADQYNKLTVAELNAGKGDQLIQKYQNINRAAQLLQNTLSRPVNFAAVQGLQERSLDDIAYKIRQLQSYRAGLNLATERNEINQVNQVLDRLKKKQDEILQSNENLKNSNNALARSWNYMKNRLAFYFTVGASTAFVKNLIEVRSQYEMNERALGILINSAERGSQIFNELSQMALVSPYTLIELSTAAKQLTAYDVAAKDVVDTTRRLADMAAAVGIPIERLTYALGQIKAYGYLNARDARMFSNAGIPLVKQLSNYYTELEGRLVSTADVYDRIKKKSIDYADVMQVIGKMTDEGGKFFDFQAKMADTLKVQLANLTLAWNNMLNDIGESNEGILRGGIAALKELFLHWQAFSRIIYDTATAFGVAYAANLLLNAMFGKGTVALIRKTATMRTATAAEYEAILSKKKLSAEEARLMIAMNKGNVGLRAAIVNLRYLSAAEAEAAAGTGVFRMALMFLGNTARVVGAAIKGLVASLASLAPMLLGFLAIGAVVDVFQTIQSRGEAIKSLNDSIAKSAKESANSITEVLTRLAESGVTAETATKLSAEEQKKAWADIREQIELSAASSNAFIQSLLQQKDMGKRVEMGIGVLESIKQVHELMSQWHDDAIVVTEDFKVLGIGADGLAEDMDDFVKAYNEAGANASLLAEMVGSWDKPFRELIGLIYDVSDALAYIQPINIGSWLKELGGLTGIDILSPEKNNLLTTYEEVQSEMKKTSDSIMKQILEDNITNAAQIKEIMTKTISDIAQERNWSEQQTNMARLMLEQQFAESDKQIFRDAVADKSTAWDMWMKFLTARHKTEFTNMGEEEITAESWAQDKRKTLYEKTFEKFKEYNSLAASQIEDTVNNLNQLQVHIRVFYDEQNQPSWIEQDFKRRLPNSTLNVKEYKDVTALIEGEQKALKSANEEMRRLRNAGVNELDPHFLDVKNRADQATEALDAYNAEHEKTTKKTKKGGGGSKKDPLLDMLKEEIDLVKKLRGEYDKLTKGGASSIDALDTIRATFGKTLNLINSNLSKNGLPQLSLAMIQGKNPNKELAHFEATLQTLVNRGALTIDRAKALETVVNELKISAKTYNLEMITKGLNNELGKLKDEYELALELDAQPELGELFADMWGINTETLPHTVKEYADDYVKLVNKYLKDNNAGLQLPTLDLTDDDLRAFEEMTKNEAFNEEWYKVIETGVRAIRAARKKDYEETSKEWDKLIEKYGGLQAKILKIAKDTTNEQIGIIRKFGEDEDIKQALQLQAKINLSDDPEQIASLSEQLNAIRAKLSAKNPKALNLFDATTKEQKSKTSKAYWDDFKDSELYSMTFEDMQNVSTRAIKAIIGQLDSLKDKVKEDPASMKALIKSLEDAEKELITRNPFGNLVSSYKEWRDAVKDVKTAKEQLRVADNAVVSAERNLKDAQDAGDVVAIGKATKNLADSRKKQSEATLKVTKTENAAIKAQKKFADTCQSGADMLNNFSSIIEQFVELLGVAEDSDADVAIKSITKALGVMAAALGFAASMAMVLNSTMPYLAAIAAVLGVITAAFSFLSGQRDARITRQIKESERAVKRLENTYKNLTDVAENAYGAMVSGAQKAMQANKELQLVEVQRQLALEKSRSKKKRDEDKIIDLEGQVIELRNEIKNATQDVINDMLGISSAGDGIESLVQAMIDAFRNGEDAMQAFGDKWDEMIDNMMLKLIVSHYMQKAWDKIMSDLSSMEDNMLKRYSEENAKAQQEYDRLANMTDNDIAAEIARQQGKYVEYKFGMWRPSSEMIAAYRAAAENALRASTETLNDASYDYTQWSLDYMNHEGRDYMMQYAQLLKDSLGNWYTYGENSEKSLSALQQGITGITEDTAGALEAYMNGVSQQVYLHSDLLTQIRDAVVGFDGDVQLATLSQVLLQLQSSYTVQMSIQSILEGWNNPSGRAVRVELIS